MKTKSTIRKLINALCLLTTLAAQTASGFYDPNLQRWLTLDPLGEAGGINLYQFVGNNPVNGIDPDGREVLNYYIAPNGQPTARAPDVGYHPARYKAAGLVGVSMIPGVGEAMDVAVLLDPESKWWEKALASTSLSLNAMTEGLLPNVGAFTKSGRLLCKETVSSGLSRQVIDLAEANIRGSGATVLGHFPGYIEKAKRTGSSHFDIGDAWKGLTDAQRWAANRHFLDKIADAGDQVFLSLPKTKIRPDSWLAREVEYLTKVRGYKWVNQWSLRPAK